MLFKLIRFKSFALEETVSQNEVQVPYLVCEKYSRSCKKKKKKRCYEEIAI